MDVRSLTRDSLARTGLLGPAKALRGALVPGARRAAEDDLHLLVILTAVLREDSNCVDIGAHRGSVLEHLVRLAPRGRHTAFEPLPHLVADLRARFPGVDVHEAAVAAGPGEASFVHVLERPDYSGLRSRDVPGHAHSSTISVRLEALDDVLEPDQPVHLVKIDVEGAELGVLQGAARTLSRHHPLVVFEHGLGGSDHYGTTPEQIHDLLSQAGLRVFDLSGGGPYDRQALRRVYDSRSAWNFLARP